MTVPDESRTKVFLRQNGCNGFMNLSIFFQICVPVITEKAMQRNEAMSIGMDISGRNTLISKDKLQQEKSTSTREKKTGRKLIENAYTLYYMNGGIKTFRDPWKALVDGGDEPQVDRQKENWWWYEQKKKYRCLVWGLSWRCLMHAEWR